MERNIMDLESIKLFWNTGLTAISLLLGWLWNSLNKRLEDMDNRHTSTLERRSRERDKEYQVLLSGQQRLQEVLTNVQINYVHKDELKEMRREFLERFDRIEQLIRKNNGS